METKRQQLHLKGKKVLVFGLGLLGGGVATTNWLLKQGAKVTVTDAKTKEELLPSLKKLKGFYKLSLGGDMTKNIRSNAIIVVNPAVPPSNTYIRLALKLGKRIENDATLFFHRFAKKIVGITGTRGKTTTVHWTNHFLSQAVRSAIAGNSPTDPFLKLADKGSRLDVAVAEVPSFQLEFFDRTDHAPDVAVVTNIYSDHINWHGSQERYARAKANLFRKQRKDQHLLLNADSKWTPGLLKKKPKAHLWFFSAHALPKNRDGVFYRGKALYWQFKRRAQKLFDLGSFVHRYGEHNLYNLMASSLAAYLAGASWLQIQNAVKTLPEVKFRQEKVFENKKLKVINDTAATSPDGGIAALKRFGGRNTVLITGGTDRQLDFTGWAKELPTYIRPDNLVFLSGSATHQMRKLLPEEYLNAHVYDTLKECLAAALKRARGRKSVILFSPASKSFEKFKNEYDRGEQFNRVVKKLVRG